MHPLFIEIIIYTSKSHFSFKPDNIYSTHLPRLCHMTGSAWTNYLNHCDKSWIKSGSSWHKAGQEGGEE